MRSEPSNLELLLAVRQTVAEGLAPHLPKSLREEAQLVVRAIDLVTQRMRGDPGWPERVRDRRAAPYEGPGSSGIEDRFAADLRAGAFESDTRTLELALDVLREITSRKLAEDNPDYPR